MSSHWKPAVPSQPKRVSSEAGTPSTLLTAGVELVVARPSTMSPPHRPRSFWSRSLGSETLSDSAVMIIGFSAVPFALMSALTITTRPEASSPVLADGVSFPLMMVPGWMVSVAPGRTKMRPSSR